MTASVHPRHRERLLFAAILLLALAVRLWDLRARSLWFDEAGEYWVSTAPFAHLVESVRTGTGDPPLYEFLLHAWMQIGTGEAWLRLLSVIVSVSGVAAVMILARMLGGSVARLGAGVLMALLPADVRYAQEAGQYGLVPAAVAWNLVCLVMMTREKNWSRLFAWVLTALAASYLYYATIFPISAAFLCVVIESVWRRDARARRATGTALVLYIAGLLPLLLSYLPTQLARVVESGGTSSPEAHDFMGIVRHKWEMSCELIGFQFTGWPHTHIPSGVVVAPALFMMAVAIRKSPRLLIWFAVAINMYAAAAALDVFPMGYRWGLILTPLIICAIATGLMAPGRKWMQWATIAAFALLVSASVYSLPNRSLRDRVYEDKTGAWPETEDMRVVAQYWMQHRSPDQPTYVYYGAAPAFAYYTRDVVKRTGLPSTWCLACWHDNEPPAFCRNANIYYGRWLRRLDSNEKLASVVGTLGGAPESFWMVFGHMVPGDDREMIAGFKREGYRVAAAIEGINASACLLTRAH
jgi:4-amino-4-deoxy-L-arabinose transferase-like glycosyltransferase